MKKPNFWLSELTVGDPRDPRITNSYKPSYTLKISWMGFTSLT